MKPLMMVLALMVLPIYAMNQKGEKQQTAPRMIRRYGRNLEILIRTLPFKYLLRDLQISPDQSNKEKK
jgi:hypothetical protein